MEYIVLIMMQKYTQWSPQLTSMVSMETSLKKKTGVGAKPGQASMPAFEKAQSYPIQMKGDSRDSQ